MQPYKSLVGKAVNPAHQNPDFPTDLSIKLNIILELKEHLLLLGQKVCLIMYNKIRAAAVLQPLFYLKFVSSYIVSVK
jgi:hypothetical protein